MVGHDGVRKKRNRTSFEGLAHDALECVVISITGEELRAFRSSVENVVGDTGNVHSLSSWHDETANAMRMPAQVVLLGLTLSK
jgi:hypothetical protein